MEQDAQLGVVRGRRMRPLFSVLAGTLAVATLASAGVRSTSQHDGAGVRENGALQYIVEGGSVHALRVDIANAGGRFVEDLPIVHAVVARLRSSEARQLAAMPGLSLTLDSSVTLTGGFATSSTTSTTTTTIPPFTGGPVENFQAVTGASQLWAQGDRGQGVTVAVLDTGINASLSDFAGRVIDGVDLTGANAPYVDSYGHGTFVAGLIAGDGASSGGTYSGEAPSANLVSIKVAGPNGLTSESTVIQGINWAVLHHFAPDNIKVLNLSLGVAPTGPAATNPLDQAVESAWNAGITVVASAGNAGATSGSIASPGDDPRIITVGTLDTTAGSTPSSWTIPAFSGVGPTKYDGAFKPDIVAPGRSLVSAADPGSTIYTQNASSKIGNGNFVGSGTSFSAAITSGEVALMLEKNPWMTPDQVKGALLVTATKGPVGDPFVDGHGVTDVAAAAQVQGSTLNQLPAELAEILAPLLMVSLTSAWTASTWNPANWSGPAWTAAVAGFKAVPGTNWNDTTWTGAAWNGLAWNGSAWNGTAWNGTAWNGAFWNGAAWNGSAWNGSAWNGTAWNGSAWNGTAWNDTAWSGAGWADAR